MLRLAGRLDLARLRRAVRAVVDEDPILRARLAEPRPFEGRWELSQGDEVPAPACELVESNDTEAATAAFLIDLSVRDEGPYFRLRVIRSGARDALCLRVDHRLCDGTGTKTLVHRLADRYRRLAAGAPLPPARVSFDPRTLAGLAGRAPLPVPTESPPDGALTYAFTRTGSANESPDIAVRVVDAAAVAAARRAGKPLGATLTDVVLTALVRALQPHATVPPGDPLVLMVTSDLRSRLPPGRRETLANLFQGHFPELRCDPAEPFASALAAVAREMGRVRASFSLEEGLRGEAAFSAVFRRYAGSPEPSRAQAPLDRTFVLLSNVGAFDEARLDLGGPEVVDAQLLGTVSFGREVLVCVSSFRGALTFSIGYCASDFPPPFIEGILDRLVAEVRACAAAVGP